MPEDLETQDGEVFGVSPVQKRARVGKRKDILTDREDHPSRKGGEKRDGIGLDKVGDLMIEAISSVRTQEKNATNKRKGDLRFEPMRGRTGRHTGAKGKRLIRTSSHDPQAKTASYSEREKDH